MDLATGQARSRCWPGSFTGVYVIELYLWPFSDLQQSSVYTTSAPELTKTDGRRSICLWDMKWNGQFVPIGGKPLFGVSGPPGQQNPRSVDLIKLTEERFQAVNAGYKTPSR